MGSPLREEAQFIIDETFQLRENSTICLYLLSLIIFLMYIRVNEICLSDP